MRGVLQEGMGRDGTRSEQSVCVCVCESRWDPETQAEGVILLRMR
jgi:hypothetical protein